MKPIVYDLFCGLGGWSEGFLAEGYECIGFDIEAHDYGTGGYPGTLILRDIRSIHGSELKDATCIVASPPCQAYSYRAMPWKRAKALPPPDNTLFNECFRIQREAIEAAGHHIPLIVENVRGAQKWVGRARWNYGSFYLWGDVPALMPLIAPKKLAGRSLNAGPDKWRPANGLGLEMSDGGRKVSMNFHEHEKTGKPGRSFQSAAVAEMGLKHKAHNPEAVGWFGTYKPGDDPMRNTPSKSPKRKAASAMIAKIPFPLANWIAKAYKPKEEAIA